VDPWTGWLGDRYGHKQAYTIGIVLNALAMLVYGFSQNFLGMLAAEITAGFGLAFMSEAKEAWLENSVTNDEATATMAVAETRSRLVGILSAILGAAVGSFSLALPWLLSAISALPILFMLWKYPWHEEVKTEQKHEAKNELKVEEKLSYSFKEAKLVWQNGYLRNAVVITMLVAFLAQPLNMFWNARFQPEIGQFGLGLLWAVVAVAIALGAKYAGKFTSVTNRMLGFVLLAIGATTLVASSQIAILALIGFVAHEAPRGFLGPTIRTYVRAHTPAHLRAYFGSIRSALTMLAAAAGLLVVGPLADKFGIIFTWQIVSVVFILSGLAYVFKKK